MSATLTTSGAKAVLTWTDWGEPETMVSEVAGPAVMLKVVLSTVWPPSWASVAPSWSPTQAVVICRPEKFATPPTAAFDVVPPRVAVHGFVARLRAIELVSPVSMLP